MLLLSEIKRNKGNCYCFTECVKKKTWTLACIWMLETNLLQTWYGDRHYWITGTFWYKSKRPWPSFKVTGVQNSRNFCANYLMKFSIDVDGIWYTVETCWSDELHTLSLWSDWYWRERNSCGSVKKNFSVGLFQTFTDRLLSNCLWWQKSIHSIFWYQFGWPWSSCSFKVTVVWEVKHFCAYFLASFQLIWMKISSVSTFGLLKLMLNVFGTINIQGRDLCLCNSVSIKYTFAICLYRDTCEPICFKLNMLLDMTTPYSLIPVWMTLAFS